MAKADKKFVVRSKSGKIVGRYHTQAEAARRVAQLKAGADRLRQYQFKGGGAHSWPGQPRRHAKAARLGHRQPSRSPTGATEFKYLMFGTRFKFVDFVPGFGQEEWTFIKTGHNTYRNPSAPPGKKYDHRVAGSMLVVPEYT